MAFYPCKPSNPISTPPSVPIGFYRCWQKESEPEIYLKQFRVDQNATSFNIVKGG